MSSEPGDTKPEASDGPAKPEHAEQSSSSTSYLGGWLSSSGAAASAWDLWESVKNNPKVVEAQHQAQQVLQNYDGDALKAKLAELGKSATEYLDEADRRLETLETGAVSYLQQRGTEIVEKVRHAAAASDEPGPPREGEVLYTGPDRAPVSRLDAELQVLHTSPDRIRAKTDAPASTASAAERADMLLQSSELSKLHAQLAPELGETEFWNRYAALRTELEEQDRRRKLLIETENKDEFEGWGSSEDEDGAEDEGGNAKSQTSEPQATKQTTKPQTTKSPAAKTQAAKQPQERKPIDEEASDIDWE